MSNPNTTENFKSAFADVNEHKSNPYLGITYSDVFMSMMIEASYPSPDFVREQIQAGINKGDIAVGYGVLNTEGRVETCFSNLENKPELTDGQTVEPVFFAGPGFYE